MHCIHDEDTMMLMNTGHKYSVLRASASIDDVRRDAATGQLSPICSRFQSHIAQNAHGGNGLWCNVIDGKHVLCQVSYGACTEFHREWASRVNANYGRMSPEEARAQALAAAMRVVFQGFGE